VSAGFPLPAERGPAWLERAGPESDIVLGTRARLVRNLRAFPFPHRASEAELGTVWADLGPRLVGTRALEGGWRLDLEHVDPAGLRVLRESLLLALPGNAPLGSRGLALARDLDRAALVNGQDHLHLAAFRAGFEPDGACRDVMELDAELEAGVDWAFAEDFGYLTASPTDVGTGLHLSALLHLPGLVLAGEIDKILNAMRQLQFYVRGLFGDGQMVRGALFRISNLITLGRDEAEITEDFARHVGRVLKYERLARQQFQDRDPLGLDDMAGRSLAMLRHARLMTAQEGFDRLSSVRLGVSLGILPPLAPGLLNRALVVQQSGHLEAAAGRALEGRERSAARAALFREMFAGQGD
jgi:protein arginine kinase